MISGDAYESMKEQIEAHGGVIIEDHEQGEAYREQGREDSEKLDEILGSDELKNQLDSLAQQFYEEYGYYPE